jgi:hypothetical protein
MQEFTNFENLQFVKNTKCSKFSQNLSFYYKDLRPKKKSCYNLHKESPKKIWLESENPWFRIGIWLNVFVNIYPGAKIFSLKSCNAYYSYHSHSPIYQSIRQILQTYVQQQHWIGMHQPNEQKQQRLVGGTLFRSRQTTYEKGGI